MSRRVLVEAVALSVFSLAVMVALSTLPLASLPLAVQLVVGFALGLAAYWLVWLPIERRVRS